MRHIPQFLAKRVTRSTPLANPDGVLTAYMALRMTAPDMPDAEAWERAYAAAQAVQDATVTEVVYETERV